MLASSRHDGRESPSFTRLTTGRYVLSLTTSGRIAARTARAPSKVAAESKRTAMNVVKPHVSLGRRSAVATAVDLRRRALAEGLGTALLLATVIGSGIMGDKLAGGNVALALLANTVATGAGLVALILTFGPISGAHFNPAVTLADATQGGLPWREVPAYLAAQVAGAL